MKILTGPCVLEDRDTVMRIAEKLKPLSEDKRVEFYFKASFDKANRTSLSSFRGHRNFLEPLQTEIKKALLADIFSNNLPYYGFYLQQYILLK